MTNLQLVLNKEAPTQFYIVHMTLLGNLFRLQQIKKYYENATCYATVEFKFMGEKIQLGLEKKQIEDNWVIFPRIHPCIVSFDSVGSLSNARLGLYQVGLGWVFIKCQSARLGLYQVLD